MSITQSIFSKKRLLTESVELDSIEVQDNGEAAVNDNTVEKFMQLTDIVEDDDLDELVTEAVAIVDACYGAMNMLMEAYSNLEESMTVVLTESTDLDDAKDTIEVMTEAALGDMFAALITRLKTIIQNLTVFATNAFIKADAGMRQKEFEMWANKVGDPKMLLDRNEIGKRFDGAHDWQMDHPLMTKNVATSFYDVLQSKSGIPDTTDFGEMDQIINNRNSGGGEWNSNDITLLLMKSTFGKEVKDMVKDSSIISTMDECIKPVINVVSSFNRLDDYLQTCHKTGMTQAKLIGGYHNELKQFIGDVNKMINAYESENRKAMRSAENATNEQRSLMHMYHSKRVMFLSHASSLSTVIYMKRISLIRQCINEYRGFVNKYMTGIKTGTITR